MLALGPTLLHLRSTHITSSTRGIVYVPVAAGLVANVTGGAFDRLTIGEFAHSDGRTAAIVCNDDVGRSASPRVDFSAQEVVELDQVSGEEVSLQNTDWFAMVNNDDGLGSEGAPYNRLYLGPGEGRIFLSFAQSA